MTGPWAYGFVCVGTARHGKGVCCGLATSRVKCDFPLCSQWEFDIDKVFSLPLPSYSLKGSTCQYPLKCQLVSAPVRVCVCLRQVMAKRFVWASVGQAGHSSIPSPRASIIQFPRMLRPIPTPLHTCTLTQIHIKSDTHSPCIHTHNL